MLCCFYYCYYYHYYYCVTGAGFGAGFMLAQLAGVMVVTGCAFVLNTGMIHASGIGKN